jgi:hypothetical protein
MLLHHMRALYQARTHVRWDATPANLFPEQHGAALCRQAQG